jgi:hypothetical protein
LIDSDGVTSSRLFTTNISFGPPKQVNVGLLNIAYVEAGTIPVEVGVGFRLEQEKGNM